MRAVNILKDIGSIDKKLNTYNLQKIADQAILDMSSQTLLSIQQGEPNTLFDIGIGTLTIMYDAEKQEIQYKFLPSAKFESSIVRTIRTNRDPLVETISNSLSDSLLNICF